jgi:ferredoxin
MDRRDLLKTGAITAINIAVDPIEAAPRPVTNCDFYVITEPCINVKDKACVEICPVDVIDEIPGDGLPNMLFIDPCWCIACGVCQPECPVSAIYPADELPKDSVQYAHIARATAHHNPTKKGRTEAEVLQQLTSGKVLGYVNHSQPNGTWILIDSPKTQYRIRQVGMKKGKIDHDDLALNNANHFSSLVSLKKDLERRGYLLQDAAEISHLEAVFALIPSNHK